VEWPHSHSGTLLGFELAAEIKLEAKLFGPLDWLVGRRHLDGADWPERRCQWARVRGVIMFDGSGLRPACRRATTRALADEQQRVFSSRHQRAGRLRPLCRCRFVATAASRLGSVLSRRRGRIALFETHTSGRQRAPAWMHGHEHPAP
jgi:hypothetical protein